MIAQQLKRAAHRRHARGRLVVAAAAVVIVGVLALFALELANTQASTRKGVETRFRDRARVTAALTEAIFAATGSPLDLARTYGAPVVSDAALADTASRGGLTYLALLDARGHIIASSPGLSADGRARLLARPPLIDAALTSEQLSVSDVLGTGPNGSNVVELTQSFTTARGRRVLVSGLSPGFLNAFLGGFLGNIPTIGVGGTAYVVDGRFNVLGSPDETVQIARPVGEEGLFQTLKLRQSGSFGKDRYFVAAPIANSSWRIVLTASKHSLFASVSGMRKWLPWTILVAFGLAAAAALALLSRALGTSTTLSLVNAELTGANVKLEGTNALLRRAAELTRSNAELEQFASIASHDLQEPLRKVQTFAAQLNTHERDRLSEEGQDYLRRMSDAASRMRMLIDDLLMFSRVSTQGRPFVPIDLSAVAEQTLSDLEVTIAEAGASVVVEPLPTVCADRSQMGQLLQNLIANALKFRRPGVVPEVRVSGRVSGGTAEITVRDNGIGFEPEYGTRIFRAFERLHSRSAYPGTGIGLALCRKIAERHNGTITAEGVPDVGATFVVTLPVEQPVDDSDESGAQPVSVPDSPTPTHV